MTFLGSFSSALAGGRIYLLKCRKRETPPSNVTIVINTLIIIMIYRFPGNVAQRYHQFKIPVWNWRRFTVLPGTAILIVIKNQIKNLDGNRDISISSRFIAF